MAKIPAGHEVIFTAAQISEALGVKRQTIASALRGIPADGTRRICGNLANAWRLSSLPASILSRLQQAASIGGYRDVPSLLSAPPSEYKAPLPIAQCSDECLAKTRLLREALSQAIELRNNPLITRGRLIEIGLADYRKCFGHGITERHWRDLFERTIQRAGSSQNFQALEIYLPERPQRRAPDAPQNVSEFPSLTQLIASFASPASPTPDEENSLWDAAFLLLSEASDSSETRRALLTFLHTRAPSLADNTNALRVSFDRKYGKWLGGNQTLAALDDGRSLRQHDRPVLSETERLALVRFCSQLENVSLGWSKFLASLPAEHGLRFRYRNFSTGRPRVPDWVRKEVTLDARNLGPYLRGPRTAKLAGAYIDRDPNALASGDSDMSDDLTLPIVWFERTPEGLFIGQGQLLVWMDERSWLIYALDLISDGAYSGFSIRNSWTKKAELHGLPRKKIHVEMGIWRSARVFVGSREEVGTKQTELGLRRLGIRFHHSTLPRGKVIERQFGSLQDLAQMVVGYCGRNRPVDRWENVEKQIKLVRSGEAEPERFFYEKRELLGVLQQLSCELNTTPKHGKYHEGLSPLEVYQKCFTDKLVKIPAPLRHLLASNKIETTVGRNGVAFRYGARTYRYKNSVELGRLKGQRVGAWFSPENPDWCSITDLNGENPILVPLEPLVPCDGATPDQLASAYEANANFDRYYKDMHRAIRAAFPPDFEQRRFRPVIADSNAIELGRQIQEQTAALELERREEQTAKVRTRRKARELGLSPAVLGTDTERVNEGLDLMAQARRAHDQERAESNEPVTAKTYVLKSPAKSGVKQLRAQYWALRKQIEHDGKNVFSLTHRALGYMKKAKEMDAGELTRVLEVFSAVLREVQAKGAS
jgi:hypothetical protein